MTRDKRRKQAVTAVAALAPDLKVALKFGKKNVRNALREIEKTFKEHQWSILAQKRL